MRILLDTSAYSELKRGHEGNNRRDLDAFLASPYVTLVPVSMATADRFSRIVLGLKAKGKPIPTNDIWIAAQAMETGAELVSFDRHFDSVDGLAVALI